MEEPTQQPAEQAGSATPEFTQAQKDWVLTQAFLRLQQRQFDDALVLLQGIRVLAPEDAEIYRMLSYALLMADRPEECIAMADKYLQCVPPGSDAQEISWIEGRARVRLEKAQQQSGDAAPE